MLACADFPHQADLPNVAQLQSDSCACIEDSDCIALEAVEGKLELRNVSCRWIVEGLEADCAYERRFVPAGLNSAEELEAWSSVRSKLRSSKFGGWCTVEIEHL
jgi:hypothetical protein